MVRFPSPPGPAPGAGWHGQAAIDVVTALDSAPGGLASAEAEIRLARVGPNRLAPAPPTPALAILLGQFRGVVTLLLVVAAALSVALGEYVEAAAIGVVVALNAALGFVVELRARRAMEALLQLGATRATVLRDGITRTIEAERLVPGDVIELSTGHTVPADARLLESTELSTGEAALTGESLPVHKSPAPVAPETTLAERSSMVYRGTTVTSGIAQALVTATGEATEVGRIGRLTRAIADEPTPLERRLDALGRRLAWLALAVAALVGVLGVVRGAPWGLMVETSIALAVAAVPEGLPAVATIALAMGLRRMAARHALIRRPSAVEALGSTTVICTDKTRTLTTGEMVVARVWTRQTAFDVTAPDVLTAGSAEPAVRTALILAARASRMTAAGGAISADPVELAIFAAATAAGVAPAAMAAQPDDGYLPFSSARRFAATFVGNGALRVIVKGAPGTVLAMCRTLRGRTGSLVLDASTRTEIEEANAALAGEGLRVLAVAEGTGTPGQTPNELEFVALLALMDPPAPGVRDTIARLRAAGLRTIMLTGDQRRTAEAIGRRLGLLEGAEGVVDGTTLARDGLAIHLARVGAISRITAEDKLTVVAALQSGGAVVAMLGDGVNDAPALRKADVGVAMGGRGTDVAREAAAVVLQDDRFETIAAAVEEGRVIGDNIRKFVFYLFSCNLAEILVLLVAELAGLPPPLLPLQILWLNLVTDTFPALALAMEPGDPDVMARPPRDPGEAILSAPFLRQVLFYAGLITAATLAAMVWALARPGVDAPTVAFMTLALAQIFHLGNARSRRDVLRPAAALANPFALAALATSILLQLLPVLLPPLGLVLGVGRLDGSAWLVILAGSAVAAVAGQAVRLVRPMLARRTLGRP